MIQAKGHNNPLADYREWFPWEPGLAGDNYTGMREFGVFTNSWKDLPAAVAGFHRWSLQSLYVPHPAEAPGTMPE